MKTVPNQKEFEQFIDSLLSHGDKTTIAAWLDVSPEQIHQEFSPFNEKKSKLYQALRQLWAISEPNPHAALVIAERLIADVRRWTGYHLPEQSQSELVSSVATGFSGLVIAELEKRPMQQRLRAALEAQTALHSYIGGLRAMDVEEGEEVYS